jgi:phosphoribosylanthranilate isomerase
MNPWSPSGNLWPPRIQIAGVSSLSEALFCRHLGIQAIGFTLELPSGPHDGLTTHVATKIISQIPAGIIPVVITYLSSADSACSLLKGTAGQAVQFHGGIPEPELIAFRSMCPGVKTIGCVHVRDESCLNDAERFQPPLWDALILDSFDPKTGKQGATGLTHDWSLSTRIVQSASVPVILAGGLNPSNVYEAIKTVRPHGVDVHTGIEDPDGSRNFFRMLKFRQQALSAFGDCGLL